MNFSYIAPHYRWLETATFGNALQRARICWINEIPRATRALIVGEGNGRFLCELLRSHPQIAVDCVDASERMLDIARARLQRLCPDSVTSVRFFHRDIFRWSPSNTYDLLVTHFVLDCFPPDQLAKIIQKLARAAQGSATWLVADFCVPPGCLARIHAKLWLRAMYAFFGVTAAIPARRLVDPTPYLESNGFVSTARRCWRTGFLRSEIYVCA